MPNDACKLRHNHYLVCLATNFTLAPLSVVSHEVTFDDVRMLGHELTDIADTLWVNVLQTKHDIRKPHLEIMMLVCHKKYFC